MRNVAIVLTILLSTSVAEARQTLGSYIFSRGDQSTHIRITNHDWPVGIDKNERHFWFAYGGQMYIVRDQKTLDRVGEIFAPMQALRAPRRTLREQTRPLERRIHELERESRRWERALDRDENNHEAEARVRDLERQISEVEAKLEAFEPEEERLDAEEEKLESDAELKLDRIVPELIRSGVAVPYK